MWNEVVEKTINAEANINLQPPSQTKEIESRYPRGYNVITSQLDNY